MEEPGDISMLLLEGDDSRANFELYLWDIDSDEQTEVPEPIKMTCVYCNNLLHNAHFALLPQRDLVFQLLHQSTLHLKNAKKLQMRLDLRGAA